MTEDYFKIGDIVNVHGLRGEIRVMPTTDDPSRFKLLDAIDIYFGSDVENYHLETARPHKTLMVLKLTKVDDRNAAEKLVGGVIKVPRSKALPLDENEYYQKDLLDMTVVSDMGEELGQLVQIIETGANDVYEVERDGKKPLLVPVTETVVRHIDVEDKRIDVVLPAGLWEIYE